MQWSLGEATCNFPMASKAIHSSIVLFARFFFFFQRPMKWGRMLVGTTNGQMLAPPALQWQAGAKLKSAETALNHLQLISVRAGTLYLT
jgi:hypothetical protein